MSRCGTGHGTKAKDDPFLFRNHYPLPVRVMVGLFGCVLWLLPWYLLVAPNWNHFSWLLIPYGFLGLVGAAAGTSFLLSAILGEARETRLDLSCQQLVQTSRDWLFRQRVTRTPFSDIAILELYRPSWATEETVLSLHPVLENGDSLPAFGAFPSPEEAEKIKALMGHRPEGIEGLGITWTKMELAALKKSLRAQTEKSSGGGCSDTPQIPTLH
ncbi:hypothetical protein SAMN04515647_2280 [Cohaesibacter sp. ES.047]|uniref:hypothetical protein n=1 Tax=Cohaesibacter sp. ES.047 TaxID=1798205 RepID=UPI000BB7C594|nr:hypothetical protein [Cohaesibacter sp. ES.047]SNY92031.1 hypothetical protein SAMN04515647_2280 [Cohaesibacter sp. ES.047]